MRNWSVRAVNWCLLCGSREENGRDADLCARCQAEVQDETKWVIDGEGDRPSWLPDGGPA